MLTVAVSQQKGGVGKTMLACNLAAAAHLAGLRALIIDLDRQATAFDWSVARPAGSRLDGLTVVQAVIRDGERAVDFARRRIPDISRGYDAVFLDAPARLDKITIAAAVAGDVALMPVQPGGGDFWALEETLASLDLADEARAAVGAPPVRRGFVINRAETGEILTREAEAELRGHARGELLSIVHQRAVLGQTFRRGESVMTAAPTSDAAAEILRLWRLLQKGTHGPKKRKTEQRARRPVKSDRNPRP